MCHGQDSRAPAHHGAARGPDSLSDELTRPAGI